MRDWPVKISKQKSKCCCKKDKPGESVDFVNGVSLIKDLGIYYQNVDGMSTKLLELQSNVACANYDIIFLTEFTESWLTTDKQLVLSMQSSVSEMFGQLDWNYMGVHLRKHFCCKTEKSPIEKLLANKIT